MAGLSYLRWSCIWHTSTYSSLQEASWQVSCLWHRQHQGKLSRPLQPHSPGPCQRGSVHPVPTPPQRPTHLRLVATALPETYRVAKQDSPTDWLPQDTLHAVCAVAHTHTHTNTLLFLQPREMEKNLLIYPEKPTYGQTTWEACSGATAGHQPAGPLCRHGVHQTTPSPSLPQHSETKVHPTPMPWNHPNWSPQRGGNAFLNFCFMKELPSAIICSKALQRIVATVLQKMQPNTSRD